MWLAETPKRSRIRCISESLLLSATFRIDRSASSKRLVKSSLSSYPLAAIRSAVSIKRRATALSLTNLAYEPTSAAVGGAAANLARYSIPPILAVCFSLSSSFFIETTSIGTSWSFNLTIAAKMIW